MLDRSSSFENLRDLVEKLPIMVAPNGSILRNSTHAVGMFCLSLQKQD